MSDSHKMFCEVCRRTIKANKKEQHFNKHLQELAMETDKNKRKVCRKRTDGDKPIHKRKCNHNRTRLFQSSSGYEIKCMDCGEIIQEGKF